MAADIPQELFRAHFDVFPHSTVICTTDGTIVYANDLAKATMKEEGTADLIGKTSLEIGYWTSEQDRLENLRLARQEGGSIRRIDVDKQVVDLLTTNTVTVEGVEYLISTVVDISNVLQLETELTNTLNRLESAQSLAQMGDFIADLDMENFNGSPEAMRLLGFGNEARIISTKELFSHFPGEQKRSIAEIVSAQLAGGSFEIEHNLALPELNEERWIFTRGTVEKTDDGKPFVRGTVLDVTERKRDEKERHQLQEKMLEAQRLESLGLLSGSIAHDFNNLLTGVLGNAEFALLENQIPTAIEVRLNDIITAAKRAADLTRQLLAYSGKGRFVIEAIDLSVLIKEMADLLSITLGKDNTLQLFLEDELPAVEADSTQLRQVIMNLIINAGESIEHNHGIINITTAMQVCDEEYIRQSGLAGELVPGNYVFFEVSDNGIGMDEETITKLFDPFFTTKFTGRGLGMAAVRGIVKGHGGMVKVYSEPGRGSTFKVILPISASAVEKIPPVEDLRSDWTGTEGILIVDDEMAPRNFIRSVLERFGYTVFVAADGIEALEIFRSHQEKIDLVLLDLTMPKMDGRETFLELRRIDPNVSTLLMSGYNEQDATQEFVGRGLAGFLGKPFSVKDLMEAVVQARQNATPS